MMDSKTANAIFEAAAFLIIAVITGGILSGCVSTDTTRLSTAPEGLEPVPTSEVDVYRDTSAVQCSYQEVAIIDTRGGSELAVSNDKLVNNAKEEAAEMGSNALILENFGDVEMLGSSEPTGKFLAIYEERPC
jgi:hypothetical protein